MTHITLSPRRRFEVTSIGAMAKGGAVKTAAVGIDGADSNGKANDKEMRGDAAAVAQYVL